MEKTTVKGLCGVFLNPMAGLTMILLAAIICVLCFITEMGYANADGRMTLLSTTVVEADNVSQSALNESEIQARPKQSLPNSTAGKPVDNSEGTPEQSGEWQIVKMRVTAYCPCEKCCGKYSDGVTACGHKIRPSDAFVAADKEYPFGTEMLVTGYNNGEPVKVLDRGGAICGNRLDVFFGSHEEALKWGVRYLDVKVCRGAVANNPAEKLENL